MNKKLLIVRHGGFGDCIVISPVMRWYSQNGWDVYFNTTERGLLMNEFNPRIKHLVPQPSNAVKVENFIEYCMHLADELDVDYMLNYTETIERALCKVEVIPEEWNKSKEERFRDCNHNYYEYALQFGDIPVTKDNLRPEIFYNKTIEKNAKKYLDWDKFNIVCCLIGSGHQKLYPWMPHVINELLADYKDINVITVGDGRCKDVESLIDSRAIKLSAEIHILESFAMTKYANLVISPDTGVLHASGCYKTPKIGLFGNTTIENVTKHFDNDFSIEAKVHCSPCFRIIGDFQKWCPIDNETHASLCMGKGIDPMDVIEKVTYVYSQWKKYGNKWLKES